ncbi:hypothetical protein [Carnimonas bestiolae]|uniref:hypothetical protein n=1 Tax=Carnimonas bestiolae TaxID=3402172 RepID=UPI003F4AB19E
MMLISGAGSVSSGAACLAAAGAACISAAMVAVDTSSIIGLGVTRAGPVSGRAG